MANKKYIRTFNKILSYYGTVKFTTLKTNTIAPLSVCLSFFFFKK